MINIRYTRDFYFELHVYTNNSDPKSIINIIMIDAVFIVAVAIFCSCCILYLLCVHYDLLPPVPTTDFKTQIHFFYQKIQIVEVPCTQGEKCNCGRYMRRNLDGI